MSIKPDIAALCVARNSIYKEMPGVDCYDIDRGAINFPGDKPVVCHPPCRAWSAYCRHQAKPEVGEKELGPLCVGLLRACGGVLEHPAHSRLWHELKLPFPGHESSGDWWSCQVNQSWWGDTRTKKTWLLFSRIRPEDVNPPYRLHDPMGDRRRWQVMSKNQRSASVPAFAEWLVDVARKARCRVAA